MDYSDRSQPSSPLAGRPRRRWSMRLIPLVLFALYAVYYVATNRETVPLTGRTQLVDMSREEEAALGLQSYRAILSQERVVASGPEVELVRRVGARIRDAASDVDPGFEWEFNLIDSEQANAFCLPGGKVAIYTGILPITQDEDGLATVMGHEIAHAIARHGAERMAQQTLVEMGTLATGIAVSDMDRNQRGAILAVLGAGATFGVLLPFSREHESEADHMGLILMARAGYDPRAAPKLWQRMSQAATQRQQPEFLSTHPNHETRIRQLEGWIDEALRERDAWAAKTR
jgi:metalloendopeptidase OMA1, mitochondrial